MDHLDQLEAESIYIIREVAAQFDKPCLLFSGGKDSLLCFHLAKKAFYPANIPFPIVHIDTGHNFDETIAFRDELVRENGVKLVVGSVQDDIDSGAVTEETGIHASRNGLQSVTLVRTIEENEFDCAMGGARRDEEKARAKERFFSHRDDFAQWDPKNQRPELWNLLNGHKNMGEHFRAFPISNWTELDVWQYLKREEAELPSLYFAHNRICFERNGVIYSDSDFIQLADNEKLEEKKVRFRTIGDMTCTGAVRSDADSIDEIIDEVAIAKSTERGTRADDKRSDSAMEDRKKQGYF